jgi:hypothetical protein
MSHDLSPIPMLFANLVDHDQHQLLPSTTQSITEQHGAAVPDFHDFFDRLDDEETMEWDQRISYLAAAYVDPPIPGNTPPVPGNTQAPAVAEVSFGSYTPPAAEVSFGSHTPTAELEAMEFDDPDTYSGPDMTSLSHRYLVDPPRGDTPVQTSHYYYPLVIDPYLDLNRVLYHSQQTVGLSLAGAITTAGTQSPDNHAPETNTKSPTTPYSAVSTAFSGEGQFPPASSAVQPQRPRKDSEKPHVRINATSKGMNNRSAKINHYKADDYYQDIPNPFPDWSAHGERFEYNSNGELKRACYSARQMKQFIYHHPIARIPRRSQRTNPGKMTLWIQRTPADSARRYHHAGSSKCRFEECPIKRGSIMQGHCRVVFDEKWSTYGTKSNPFSFAGCAHLYCFERFLNLKDICRLDNVVVRADTRQMVREMDGRNKTALEGEVLTATEDFLEACKQAEGAQSFAKLYPRYPLSKRQKSDFGEAYKHTLGHEIQKKLNSTRSRPARAKFNAHMGDLELFQELSQQKYKDASTKRAQLVSEQLSRIPNSYITAAEIDKATGKRTAADANADADDDDGGDDDDDNEAQEWRPSPSNRARR